MTKSSNPHAWLLSDLDSVPQNGLKVFSTFACGGGSSMGYKRAGFEMVGANDIDPQMRKHYELNLHPKMFIESPVIDLATMALPDEMFNLDILDGSPPCSTFSMSGHREKDWGREKHFREGQAVQVLDDLFFDFLKVAERLKPKVVIAENVKGMIAGNAKGYVQEVFKVLKKIGYKPQVFLVNAAYCGVPQRRERVFICAVREDISDEKLKIHMSGSEITFKQATYDLPLPENPALLQEKSKSLRYWKLTSPGKSLGEAYKNINGKHGYFTCSKVAENRVPPTIVSGSHFYHHTEPRYLTGAEFKRIGSFPDDYIFLQKGIAKYLVGMSVPPKMMQRVAESVRDQWLT
jgi:DNA (cytosine-5)-methyltransferase 1